MPNAVEINDKEFKEAVKSFDDLAKQVSDDKWVRTTQARKARKHFVPAMRRGSHSAKLVPMISVTQAKRFRGGPRSVRVGVVKNDASKFPKFSAQALASVIEYGTKERFRELVTAGIITGRQSTGEMPEIPFLRPAFDGNVGAFMNDVESTILDKLEKIV